MLYALRFEGNTHYQLNAVLTELRQRGVSARLVNTVPLLLNYAGVRKRQFDLFGNRSAIGMTKRFIKGLKGVENVYTQHEPYVTQLIDQVSRGRLPESVFACSDVSQIKYTIFA